MPDLNTKARILEAARTRFAQAGYEGVSLADLAEDVGIRKASLYAHIEGKEQLFKQIVEEMAQRYDAVWRQVALDTEGEAPLVRIDRLIMALIAFFNEHDTWMLTKRMLLVPPPPFRLFIEEKIGEVERELKQFERTQFELAIARNELPEQSLEELYSAYYCFLDGALLSLFTFEEARMTRQMAAFKIFKRGVGWT